MATVDDINSNLQNIARQLGNLFFSISNVAPTITSSSSPVGTAINNLSSGLSQVLGSSFIRHGLIFHNPGTSNVYVYPSTLTTGVGTTSLGGSFVIYPGGTLAFPSTMFPNVNCGWNAFVTGGTSQALTIVEFR